MISLIPSVVSVGGLGYLKAIYNPLLLQYLSGDFSNRYTSLQLPSSSNTRKRDKR